MKKIKANAGETALAVAQRACLEAWDQGETVIAVHNAAEVRVYPMSNEQDVAEKLTMGQQIANLHATIDSMARFDM